MYLRAPVRNLDRSTYSKLSTHGLSANRVKHATMNNLNRSPWLAHLRFQSLTLQIVDSTASMKTVTGMVEVFMLHQCQYRRGNLIGLRLRSRACALT